MPRPTSTALTDQGGTGPDDLVLVQRALRGEPGAVEGLLQRLSCVLRFVYRLNTKLGCGLPTDALEDVVQQVYLAVWPRLRDFAGSSALESWVFGFCRNCLRAEARRRRSSGRAAGLEPDELDTRVADQAPPSAGIETGPPDAGRAAGRRAAAHGRDELRGHRSPRAGVTQHHQGGCYRAMMRMKGRLQRDGHT